MECFVDTDCLRECPDNTIFPKPEMQLKTAHDIGCENLIKPDIEVVIAEAQVEREKRC